MSKLECVCRAIGTDLNSCAGWVQAWGAILALIVAVGFPIVQGRRQRKAAKNGHLLTIAADVLIAERQAAIYLRGKVRVPAYRLPLHGKQTALPALLSDGTLSGAEAAALMQFYVDATSFNYCLDLTQEQKAAGHAWIHEVNRVKLKAQHLVSGGGQSRFDAAMKVLRAHLDRQSLENMSLGQASDEEDDGQS